jgi:hypothetical protein
MKNHNGKFWKISCFILVFTLYANVAYVFAQSNPRAQQDLYDILYQGGYNLGMEMMREANREANRINFTIVNKTGVEIREIYISLSSSDSLGENLWQSNETFHNGYKVEFNSGDVGPYDIILIDIKGNAYAKGQISITSNLSVNFTGEDKVKKGILDRAKNAWNSFWN